jgi:uncharacterized repeat protein (TIGR02543 family)
MKRRQKMKTKKHGIYAAAAAVLLISALLFTGCLNMLDPSGLVRNPSDNNPNTGTLLISIGGAGARTIMPTTGIGDFDEFKVTIIDEDDDEILDDYDETIISFTAGTGTLDIPEGFYTVKVDAYIDGVLAATGEEENVEITSLGGTATVILEVIDDDGEGEFTWDITLPSGLTAATIAIFEMDGITPANLLNSTTFESDLITENSGSVDLASGYYRVVITTSGARSQSRTITEILHIYQGMISDYTTALTPLVRNNFDVTFDPGDGDLTGGLLGDNGIVEADWNTTISPQNEVSNPGNVFQGWFSAATGGTQWVFATSRVYNDITLYAQWEPNPVANITLQLNMADLGDELEFSALACDIPLNTLNTNTVVTINDPNNLDTRWTNTRWEYNGAAVTTGATKETLTINDTLITDTSEPEHIFTVFVTIDTKEYSFTLTVKLTPPSP